MLYDLSRKKSLNCNVFIPSPIVLTGNNKSKRYTLSKSDTKLFKVPSPSGIIRLTHYDLNFEYRINSRGEATININVNPFPSYDTIWIQFCKAVQHILEKTIKTTTVAVKNPITKILIPHQISNKHYTIRKNLYVKRYISSKSTVHPFQNYPREIVRVVAHWRTYTNPKVGSIFIDSFESKRVKLNKATPTRLIS